MRRTRPTSLLTAVLVAMASVGVLAPSLADAGGVEAGRALDAVSIASDADLDPPPLILDVPAWTPLLPAADEDRFKRDLRQQAAPQVVETAPTEVAVAPSPASSAPESTAGSTSGRAAAPAPTDAATTGAEPAGPGSRWDRVGRQALQRIRMDWQGLGWSVEFQRGRGGRLGFANRDRHVVEIYVRDSHDVADVAATLAHELTHVLDYERLGWEQRDRWLSVRDLEHIDWWPACSCDDRAFGAGDLAEAAAVLASGRGQWTGHHAAPTDAQLRVAAEILGWSG